MSSPVRGTFLEVILAESSLSSFQKIIMAS